MQVGRFGDIELGDVEVGGLKRKVSRKGKTGRLCVSGVV